MYRLISICRYVLFILLFFPVACFRNVLFAFQDYAKFSARFTNNGYCSTSNPSTLVPFEVRPLNDYTPRKRVIRLLKYACLLALYRIHNCRFNGYVLNFTLLIVYV